MPDMCPTRTRCRLEAARLIELARALLPNADEAMAVSHLDHALELLDSLTQNSRPPVAGDAGSPNLSAPAPAQDPDSQAPARARLAER